jgi:3',5'-cyclic AMP phosphodiesterase CpdA
MKMSPLSQHPAPEHVVVHISDTHLLESTKLYGSVDSDRYLFSLMERLVASGLSIDALVFTGDLADKAEPGAYRRLRDIIEPYAQKLEAAVVWVMGNHDERESFSEILFDQEPSSAPQDRVYDLGGLRLIALDTSVPGFHHGELSPDQLQWLVAELATPAPHGTILALHHPPIPTPIVLMGMIELEDQKALAAVVEGTDVRAVLAGHLHYTTFSTFAGVPISVAAASCYNIDLIADRSKTLSAVSGGVGASLVHVYPDQVVFSSISFDEDVEFTSFPTDYAQQVTLLSREERKAMFSAKDSDFNKGVDHKQSGS